MLYLMCMITIFLLGIAIGWLLNKCFSRGPVSVGTLRIDRSDGDGPYIFLELEVPPEVLEKSNYVNMKVLAENYISHK